MTPTQTSGINFKSVPLVINHDWASTVARMNKLLPLQKHCKVEEYGTADHYIMNSLGTLSKQWDSKSWYKFAGPAINSTMPWIEQLLTYISELRPNDGGISFLDDHGAAHYDLPSDPSALIYIVHNTDPDAYTWFKNENQVESYPSIVGSAWIINTQVEHGIWNQGTRYALSIHFKEPYEIVKKWFQDKTQQDLTFG